MCFFWRACLLSLVFRQEIYLLFEPLFLARPVGVLKIFHFNNTPTYTRKDTCDGRRCKYRYNMKYNHKTVVLSLRKYSPFFTYRTLHMCFVLRREWTQRKASIFSTGLFVPEHDFYFQEYFWSTFTNKMLTNKMISFLFQFLTSRCQIAQIDHSRCLENKCKKTNRQIPIPCDLLHFLSVFSFLLTKC